MKRIILCFVALLGLASFSDQLAISENENVTQPANQVDNEYHYYLEKARWGDAGAYVKLADFYREGKYVQSDFMGMTAMLAMAEQYDRNHRLKDYLNALPEDDSYRLMFEAMDEIGRKYRGKVKNVASVLVTNGKPEGYVINGAIQVEEGDTIGGIETIRYGADQGSAFGELILCVAPAFLGKNQQPYNAERLISMADQFPFANNYIHGVATYLAVQWTGNLLPNTKIDTGSGAYESRDGKLVKDHNWRRGGYGEITGHIYEIFIAEKHNSTRKCVFLPKYLGNRNKYITFAA